MLPVGSQVSIDRPHTELSQIASLRLEPGNHEGPHDGVCVVEMASLVAGEEFSDRPDCVCEVIAAFLRNWNDRASYVDRQRLRPYAGLVVGTRADPEATRVRRDVCLAWAGADLDGGPLRSSLSRFRMRLRIAWLVGIRGALRLNEGAAEYAARLCFGRHDTEEAFRLLDLLLEVGADHERAAIPEQTPNGNGAVNGNGNGNGNGHAHRRQFVEVILRARARGVRDEGAQAAPVNGNGAAANGNGSISAEKAPNSNGRNGHGGNGSARKSRPRRRVSS